MKVTFSIILGLLFSLWFSPLWAESSRKFAYELKIEVDSRGLQPLLQGSSTLQSLQDRPPESLLGLKRRLQADLKRFQQVLRSEGYYQPDLRHKISSRQSDFSPYQVQITIKKGVLYRLAAYQIRLYRGEVACPQDDANCPALPPLKALGLTLQMGGKAERIIAAQRLLLAWFKERGYPFPGVLQRTVYLQQSKKSLRVVLDLDLGPLAKMGALQIVGLKEVKPSFVAARRDGLEGDLYQQQQLNEMRSRLIKTHLFETVRVRAGSENEGVVPLQVVLVENEHRTLGTGITYATTDGMGIEGSWQHRNFTGVGDNVRVDLDWLPQRQYQEVTLRRPNLENLGKTLFFTGTATQKQSDAFDQYGAEATLGQELKLNEHLSWTYGISVSYDNLDDNEGDHRAVLLGLPNSLSWDSRDDLLDPRDGFRFKLIATPFAGSSEMDLLFLKLESRASYYFRLDKSGSQLLASRFRFGSLQGEPLIDIPANRRFYAGGAIRGYGLDRVGPLDSNNNPTGGLSVVEF
ncbi:MAG: BamA/TamA family outer membrane protein, partial [Gammaproteobacteria bacterium]|nr:BamA/TamA family outer membrane protein [Gammaproteobacteria bacterium]